MATQETLFGKREVDICEGKHGGVRTSVAAFERGKDGHASMRERIRVWVHHCGFRGTTAAEIERTWGIPKNKFSGRISQLLAEGRIFDSGRELEDGCRVLVARKEWVNGSAQ